MVVPLLRPAADFTIEPGMVWLLDGFWCYETLVVNLKMRLAVYGNAVIELLLYIKSGLCGRLPEFGGRL